MRQWLLISFLIAGCLTAMPQTNEPPKKTPAEMMREMRLKQLTMLPSEFGEKPTAEFPHVSGVLMDSPVEAGTVTFTSTVVARTTGDASIYTTGTFGVFGGIGHESVRSAAKSCVKVAERHFEDASPTKDYPYPKAGRVRFYLVGYDGVRVIDSDLESLRNGNDKCSDLYEAVQRVVTELRLITQEQQGERR
ncbi:MAG: hypothetical protein ABSE16_05110 [Verrucomicrobiota bacterium]|jgi:hypothetical protein